MKKLFSLGVAVSIGLLGQTQILAGPMLGPVELRDAKVWVEVAPTVKSVQLVYNKKGETATKKVAYKGALGNEFNPVQFTIGGLDLNTTYEYRFLVDGKPAKQSGEFTTRDLWQWRKPAPDFTFLAGSCAYFNQPEYDRPGKPYGGDSSIFLTMAKEKAAYMLWMGDNWYTREVDFSQWGMWYRPHVTRMQPVLQPLFKAMSHYATWDDHDYGPNDIGGSFILKEESKKIFDSYWLNPSSGFNGQGVYTQVAYSDVELFVTDDRWWRSADDLPAMVNGKPNPEKHMLGAVQMEWLKNALRHSQATFKIIVVGSQVLNPASAKDKMADFPVDYNNLLEFIAQEKLNGVLFMSGDRHHSEVIKVDRPGTYPLYDITISSLTAGVVPFTGPEKENPYRLVGVDKNNYGRVTVSGARGQRKLLVEYLGVKGEKLGEWSIAETALKTPAQK